MGLPIVTLFYYMLRGKQQKKIEVNGILVDEQEIK